MADFFFGRRGEDELFCDRQKRMVRERVDRVMAILRRDLAEPPTLEKIGREAGCSPFYLSRTFSRETGMTIPQCLRKLRMDGCRIAQERQMQCDRGGDGSRLQQPEPFQPGILPDDGLLPGTISAEDADSSSGCLWKFAPGQIG